MMRIPFATLSLLLTLLLAAPAALSQTSDAQLRKENERLREETHRLRLEVDDLRERLEVLEGQMELLLRSIEALRSGEAVAPPPSITPTRPLPDDPFASPDAMLAHLQKTYEEDLGDEPRDTLEEIARYKRLVERWVGKMNRELRSNVRWIVSVQDVAGQGANAEVTLQVVDPKSGEAIGGPFKTQIPRRMLRQSAPIASESPLLLEGVMSANLLYDPQRDVPGMFNEPAFIGPYAVFRYVLIVRSLAPYEMEPSTGDNDPR